MNMVYASPKPQAGFTLVEMAMVLLIVALLLGGLLPTISSQVEQRRVNETRKQLDEIQQALIGFAVINGRLPCPTTQKDPANAKYGEEDTTCPPAGATSDGILPWKTLGVPETDVWGSKRSAITDPWTGYWRYRVDRNFATVFSLTTSLSATDALVVKDASGSKLTTTTESPLAIVYSTGANLTADGQNTNYDSTYQSDVPNPQFDDILVWVSRPRLFNRMVTAGKLP